MRKCLSDAFTHTVGQVAQSLISCHLDHCAPARSTKEITKCPEQSFQDCIVPLE